MNLYISSALPVTLLSCWGCGRKPQFAR